MKKYFYILFLFGLSFYGYAQVGIGVKSPGVSTMLDIQNPKGDRGVLLPKVSLVDKGSFTPITGRGDDPYNIGLIVYNKTENTAKGLVEGYYYWTGREWTSFSNDIDILEIIEKQVSKGAVFYGKVQGESQDVLYTKIKNKEGIESIEVINLLPTIINNIHHVSQEDVFELKKALGYDITEQVAYTGKSIKGKYVYSFYGTTNIESDNAEVEGVPLTLDVVKLLSKGEVFKILLLDSKYQLIDISTTDIGISTKGVLKFSLGSSSMYMTLPEGKYGVIVELLSSIEKI